jgi:hypothetical protein
VGGSCRDRCRWRRVLFGPRCALAKKLPCRDNLAIGLENWSNGGNTYEEATALKRRRGIHDHFGLCANRRYVGILRRKGCNYQEMHHCR